MINYHLGKSNGLVKRVSAVCPGPNIAYFSKIATLQEMADHIYGRINLRNSAYRPHMFIKELKMYIDYLIKEVKKAAKEPTEKQRQHFTEFKNNMFDGIAYYQELFPRIKTESEDFRAQMLKELEDFKVKLEDFIREYRHSFIALSVIRSAIVSA